MKFLLAVITLSMLFATFSRAGAVAQWSYSSLNINEDGSLEGYPDTVASPAVRSSSLTESTSPGGTYSAGGWSISTQADLTKYFQFTITPYSNISFDWSTIIATFHSGSGGPTQWQFRTSSDNFSTVYSSTPIPSTNSVSFNISAVADTSNPVIFRLYGLGATSATGSGGFSNIEIDAGQYPVPEPTSFILLLISFSILSMIGLTRRCS